IFAVAPDYAENVKFADEWLRPHPGTDAALALGMGHTILKEFYVEKPNEYFLSYAKQYTDLPFLVELSPGDSGAYRPGKFVVAADLDPAVVPEQGSEHAEFKPVMMDTRTNGPVVPPGTLGHRFNDEGIGRWHLDLGEIEPALSLLEGADDAVEVLMPRFDTTGQGGRGDVARGVPVRRVGDRV